MLPVNDEGAVLLLRSVNPAQQTTPFLITVGGGIEPGESEREAAVRELWEETGRVVGVEDLVGPIHAESFTFVWDDHLVTQHQNFYVVAARDATVVFDHHDELELANIVGHGWWTPDQLRECTDIVLPEVRRAVEAAGSAFDRLR